MTKVRFEYIFDPLCGWCYACAPALAGLARAWPEQLEMRPSGLFSDAGARELTQEWASYAWTNDQRIEAMTGQAFSEDYHRKVLLGDGLRFDSGVMNRALTAVHAIDASLEPALLHRLQVARYVDGEDNASAAVVAQIAADVLAEAGHALDAETFSLRLEDDAALAGQTHERVRATQALMSRLGIRGVPQLLVDVDGAVQTVGSASLYKGPRHLMDTLAALAGGALPQPAAA